MRSGSAKPNLARSGREDEEEEEDEEDENDDVDDEDEDDEVRVWISNDCSMESYR